MGDGSLHCENRNFRPFMLLDPMTFIYELDPYSQEIHWMCIYELPMSNISKVIVWQWSLLVTWQRWQSHHWIGHTRHANLMDVSFIEPKSWVIKVYIARIGILDIFDSCDSLNFHIRTWPVLPGCADMNFLHQGFRKLSSDRRTYSYIQNWPKL